MMALCYGMCVVGVVGDVVSDSYSHLYVFVAIVVEM